MKLRIVSCAVSLGGLLATFAGCGDSDPPFEPELPVPHPYGIRPASPTAFHAPPGSKVPSPVVFVLDQFGRPMPGIPVRFAVETGGGLITNRIAVTDQGGLATAGGWVLGPEPGENLVVATMDTLGLGFMATATLEPVEAAYALSKINGWRLPTRGGPIGGYYILFEDGTFRRGWVSRNQDGIHSSLDLGTFSVLGSVITFNRDGYSWAGHLRDDELTIEDYDFSGTLEYTRTPPAPPSGGFPPVSRPATVYNREAPHSYPSGALSRYVLYPDSTFALQYLTPRFGFGEYLGNYSRADSRVTFRFHNRGPVWEATGTLRDRRLIVEYNLIMALSDFEDGAYVRAPGGATGGAHLYVANPDGAGITSLTPGEWPAWSPDGQQIAFERDGDVHVISSDGSFEMRLAAGGQPAWSPDGTRIGFTSSEGIAVMNTDGSTITTLIRHDFRDDTWASGDMGVGKPAWSPDGERIAFEHLGDGDLEPAQIYVMNADGSDPRRPTALPGGRRYAESDPSWSPDGSRLVFWSYGYGLATVDANGGVPTSIYWAFPDVAYGAKPAWSPDGGVIAFNAHRGSSAGPAVWVVSADGGGAKMLVEGGYDASWSPDGARIAFVSTRRD